MLYYIFKIHNTVLLHHIGHAVHYMTERLYLLTTWRPLTHQGESALCGDLCEAVAEKD